MKPSYKRVQDYIPRFLQDGLVEGGSLFQDREPLSKKIRKENRIVILGEGGFGKSIELRRIAGELCNQTDIELLPILIKLGNLSSSYGLKHLVAIQFPEFYTIDQSKLLFLFDGLDEVQASRVGDTISEIENFTSEFPESSFVVASRRTHYSGGFEKVLDRIQGFKSFFLSEINYEEKYFYVQEKLGEKSHRFHEIIQSRNLYDLTSSPFYLVELVKIFSTSGDLPSSRPEIYEDLIKRRVLRDNEEKYQKLEVNLHTQQHHMREAIERLAFAMMLLGRNRLSTAECDQLLSKEMRTLLNYLPLLDYDQFRSYWQFEHKNFQEYLAASFLSKISFRRIRHYVSIKGKRIRVHCIQSLSFLFELSSKQLFQKLINWLIEVEPDILVNFEKSQISIEIRENIFIRVFEDFEEKDIIIRNQYFDRWQLIALVSDSKRIFKYLWNKLDQSTSDFKKTEILKLLPLMELEEEEKKAVSEKIFEHITYANIPEEERAPFFREVDNLGSFQKELFDRFIKNVRVKDSKHFRRYVGWYLLKAKNLNDYSELIIDCISEGIEDGQSLTGYSGWYDDLVEGNQSIDLHKKLTNWAATFDFAVKYRAVDLVEAILTKSKELHVLGRLDLFEDVLAILFNISKRYVDQLDEVFQDFFISTNTAINGFKRVYDHLRIDEKPWTVSRVQAWRILATKDCCEFVFEQYKQKKVGDEVIKLLLHAVHDKTEIYEEYYRRFNEISNNAFVPKEPTWQEQVRARDLEDISLLLNKSEFITQAKELFRDRKKNELTRKEIWENRFRPELDDFTIVHDFLSDSAGENTVELEGFLNTLEDDSHWCWVQVDGFLRIALRREEFDYPESCRSFLLDWVNRKVQTLDFERLYEFDGKLYHFLTDDHYLPFFVDELDINLEDDIYLNFLMLWTEKIPYRNHKAKSDRVYPNNIYSYVISKVGLEKVKSKLLHLKRADLLEMPEVIYQALKFCYEQGMHELASSWAQLLINRGYEERRPDILEIYIDIGGSPTILIDRFSDYSLSLKIAASEALQRTDNPNINRLLLQEFQTQKEEFKFLFLRYLGKRDKEAAFVHFKTWVLANGRFPDDHHRFSTSKLIDLMDFYDGLLQYRIPRNRWYGSSAFVPDMVALASERKEGFLLLNKKINFWLRKYPDECSFLHYEKQALEKAYYSQKLEFEAVMRQLNHAYNPDSWFFQLIELKIPLIPGVLNLDISKALNAFRRVR